MRRSAILFCAAVLCAAAPGQTRAVDRPASRIGFRGGADGRGFSGVFKRWDARVGLDPADLGHARLSLSIDAASGVTGDPVRDRALPARLDLAHFPRILFDSRKVEATAPGRFVVTGVLALKGAARAVSWPVSTTRVGGDLRVEGVLPLDPATFDGPAVLTVRLLLRAPR